MNASHKMAEAMYKQAGAQTAGQGPQEGFPGGFSGQADGMGPGFAGFSGHPGGNGGEDGTRKSQDKKASSGGNGSPVDADFEVLDDN